MRAAVLVACAFVLGSVPQQMKNFFASGLLFLAIGIIRLQQDYFSGMARWPIILIVAGICLMLWSSQYMALRAAIDRRLARSPLLPLK